MTFKIVLTSQARIDVFEAVERYDKQSHFAAKQFYLVVGKYYKILERNPYFQVRYDNVRCLPVKKFPYMIHFIVDEQHKEVVILGVISTDQSTEAWFERKK